MHETRQWFGMFIFKNLADNSVHSLIASDQTPLNSNVKAMCKRGYLEYSVIQYDNLTRGEQGTI
jgi:hypothetical protein